MRAPPGPYLKESWRDPASKSDFPFRSLPLLPLFHSRDCEWHFTHAHPTALALSSILIGTQPRFGSVLPNRRPSGILVVGSVRFGIGFSERPPVRFGSVFSPVRFGIPVPTGTGVLCPYQRRRFLDLHGAYGIGGFEVVNFHRTPEFTYN